MPYVFLGFVYIIYYCNKVVQSLLQLHHFFWNKELALLVFKLIPVKSIKRLENEGKISQKENEQIYPRRSRRGILCGSPNVHKPVTNNSPKFRPILSATVTPTYKLAS